MSKYRVTHRRVIRKKIKERKELITKRRKKQNELLINEKNEKKVATGFEPVPPAAFSIWNLWIILSLDFCLNYTGALPIELSNLSKIFICFASYSIYSPILISILILMYDTFLFLDWGFHFFAWKLWLSKHIIRLDWWITLRWHNCVITEHMKMQYWMLNIQWTCNFALRKTETTSISTEFQDVWLIRQS